MEMSCQVDMKLVGRLARCHNKLGSFINLWRAKLSIQLSQWPNAFIIMQVQLINIFQPTNGNINKRTSKDKT